MNDIGSGFGFSKDRVLKASLVLCDFVDIKFKDNFNVANMLTIEDQWGDISQSLLVAMQLLDEFGLYSENLTGENVLIPVAYYIKHWGLDERYMTAPRKTTIAKGFDLRPSVNAPSWILDRRCGRDPAGDSPHDHEARRQQFPPR
jgi:hypothetical protein